MTFAVNRMMLRAIPGAAVVGESRALAQHAPDRVALAGVLFVLRTGVAWRDVPAETVGCSGVTAWRRLRDWTEAGVWPRLHAVLLTELRRTDLLDLDDCAVDGSHVRALKGGSCRPLARRPCPPRLQAPSDRRPARNPARRHAHRR
jgi:transposase